jgi:hypothetical protein
MIKKPTNHKKGWIIVCRKENESVLIFDESGELFIAEISINEIRESFVSLGIRSKEGNLNIIRGEKLRK